MQEYDPDILQKAVDDLYSEADGIVLVYTLLGVGIGFLVGFLVEAISTKERGIGFGSILAAVVSAMVGYSVGRRRSWELRFRAQQLRLQMQIEENTRAWRKLLAER